MLRRFAVALAAIVLSSTLLIAQTPAPGAKPDVSADIRAALAKLKSGGDTSVASRIALANVAIQNNSWQAAQEVLVDAARLDPNNAEVASLMATVKKNLPAAPPPDRPSGQPTTKPADSTTKPAREAFSVKRLVTNGEMNRIRLLEMRPDEKPPLIIKIDLDTRKKFIASNPDIVAADFNQLTPDVQAQKILDSGKEEFIKGVTIKSDPASMKDFKLNINKIVVAACANCHQGNKAGNFSLYTDTVNENAVYTNFVVLQTYSATVGGAERLMVDRTSPESSLLAQFMLPPGLADVPHPNVPGFKAPAKTVNDTKYALILKWLRSLDPIAPKYGVDLSKTDEPVKGK
jgi:hypothetical protein